MYVRVETSEHDIRKQIEALEDELKSKRLTKIDRIMIHDELDYLYSFLPVERW